MSKSNINFNTTKINKYTIILLMFQVIMQVTLLLIIYSPPLKPNNNYRWLLVISIFIQVIILFYLEFYVKKQKIYYINKVFKIADDSYRELIIQRARKQKSSLIILCVILPFWAIDNFLLFYNSENNSSLILNSNSPFIISFFNLVVIPRIKLGKYKKGLIKERQFLQVTPFF